MIFGGDLLNQSIGNLTSLIKAKLVEMDWRIPHQSLHPLCGTQQG